MNGTNLLSPFKATGSGAWETTIPLTGDQKSSDQMFVVTWACQQLESAALKNVIQKA